MKPAIKDIEKLTETARSVIIPEKIKTYYYFLRTLKYRKSTASYYKNIAI